MDIVENQGYNETPFMLLYHINFGFPVVSEHTRLYSSAEKVEPWNDEAKNGDGIYGRLSTLKPGESRTFSYKIGILPDRSAITGYVKEFDLHYPGGYPS